MESGKFESGLVLEIKRNCILIKVIEFNSSSKISSKFTSDNFEIVVHQENKIISEDNLPIEFVNEAKLAICDTLNRMITNLKISKQDLVKKLKGVDFQGLYSSKDETFYLIDFGFWKNFL